VSGTCRDVRCYPKADMTWCAVDTRYIYTLALALVGLALATCAILFLMIDF
jgi:hypothetical protein